MSTQDIYGQLDRARNGLTVLLQRAPRASRKTIKQTLELLDYLELLQCSVDELWDNIAKIRAEHLTLLSDFPKDKPTCDLGAAVLALAAVITFLRSSPGYPTIEDRRAVSKILVQLRQALFDLGEGGALGPMLRPQAKNSGRRADVSYVSGLKGILAGLMRRQQRAGMSRQQAAQWVADNVSPKLAARISRKPITARMVEEWLDRFGGKHGESGPGREAYLVWSRDSRVPTRTQFKAITERIAEDPF